MSVSPVILVTGANSGVGFGICERLLQQLAQDNPRDASISPLRRNASEIQKESPLRSVKGATVILACRNAGRATAARDGLLKSFDGWVERVKRSKEYDGKAERFRKNLVLDIVLLDLASASSIFACATQVRQKYPYVSHLILNACGAGFTGINWPAAVLQVIREPITAVTSPNFKLSQPGTLSEDGLGGSWQTNVFGHYALFRALQPVLIPLPLETRVLWMSSIEAIPSFYDPEDWQLVKNEHAYEAAKYQIDLVGAELDRLACAKAQESGAMPIRHIIVEPGVCATNIAAQLLNVVLVQLMFAAFYLARWMGSVHHPIHAFKSAIVAVHSSLIPLSIIPLPSPAASNGHANGHGKNGDDVNHGDPPLKFGSMTNRAGNEYVGVEHVKAWEEFSGESRKLVERCERLYLSLAAKHSYATN